MESDAMRARAFIGGLAASLGMAAFAAGASELTMARDGKPAAAIVLAEKPTKAAQFAAFELQWHVKAISGATLPIAKEAKAGQVNIFIGDTPRARELGLSQESFKLQEYAVKAGPGELVLAGKDAPDTAVVAYDLDALGDGAKNANWPDFWEERGSLHAVYDFLRGSCGVRWLNPTDTGSVIPRNPTLEVDVQKIRRAPSFRYRGAFTIVNSEIYDSYVSLWSDVNPAGAKLAGFKAWETLAYADSRPRLGDNWLVRRLQATLFLLRLRNGGEKCIANHSLYHYYELYWAPSKNPDNAKCFVAKRPELFAQGYKDDPPPQMCYSSPALVATVAQEARDYFDKGGYPYKACLSCAPLGLKWGENFFCVEPMDNITYCKCQACQAWLDKGKDRVIDKYCSVGIHSDYVFNFVNQVAQEVKKTHPDKHIVTLAYGAHAYLPKEAKLDPSVAVQFCFTTDSWPWYRAEYEHEWKLAQEWAAEAKASGRPLYAWCYLGHLARMFAYFGGFNGFPGCFAHAIGKEFKMYRDNGYRGMFHCGLPMEVDTYVTFRLMDDADLDVDELLDEYFAGLYGPAAPPLKQAYLEIEKIFCDPKARQGKMPIGPTAQEFDWGMLGTAERMAAWGKLVDEAKRLADTPREKRNVELFDLGIWRYMVEGRNQYLARKWREQAGGPRLEIPRCLPAPGGDPLLADLSQAVTVDSWAAAAEAPSRQLVARLVHDGRNLYAELVDKSAKAAPEDAWELGFARRREPPLGVLRVAADGSCQGLPAMAKPIGPGALRVAIPLSGLAGGVEAGWHLFGNLRRISANGAHADWPAPVAGPEPLQGLGRLSLWHRAAAAPAAPQETDATLAPGVVLRTVGADRLRMATDDLLQGKPFALSPASAYCALVGQAEANFNLSDALTPRAPTEDRYAEGAKEITYDWELGQPLPPGQALRTIRLTWTIEDGQRNAVKVKFAVRDAKTRAWTELGDYVSVPSTPPRGRPLPAARDRLLRQETHRLRRLQDDRRPGLVQPAPRRA